MTIAVLLTTFNRKEKTLACLTSLRQQQLPAGVDLSVYLTDDNSSDGTREAVRRHFPEVHVYTGTGHLYWAGGMRSTWRKALEGNHDFYLLLNDDTLLFPHAIADLLKGYEENPAFPEKAICVGSTSHPQSGNWSYGGSKLTHKRLWKSQPIFSQTEYVECDFANANILLVPQKVVAAIGVLPEGYTHSLADYDYTLTAKRAGFGVVSIPGFLGTCVDDHGNNWKSQNTKLSDRLKYMKSPKGLAYSEYLSFIGKHFPASKMPEFCKLWLKTFFPFLWDVMKPAKASS
jgi:GT2 family glycosyltransferase